MKKIEIVPGWGCNFKCNYCYQVRNGWRDNAKRMNSDIAEKSALLVLKYADLYPKLQVTFYGGESLLYDDIIDIFINVLKNKSNVYLHFVTNGSLISKLQTKILHWQYEMKNRMSMLVSYDFALQDKNRCHNTHSKIWNNIVWLSENNIDYKTNTVIPTNDIPALSECYQQFLQLMQQTKNNKRFRIQFDRLMTPFKDVEEGLYQFRKYLDHLPQQYRKMIDYKFGSTEMSRFKNCGLGWRVVCGINYDGTIYPCAGACFKKPIDQLKFGVVDDHFCDIQYKRDFVLSQLNWQTDIDCYLCDAICNYCPLNTIINKDVRTFGGMPDENHCRFRKLATKLLFS